jgi:hypothetical protein
MDFESFIKSSEDFWNKFLEDIYRQSSENPLTKDKKVLYPNILLCTNAKNHFSVELVGAQEHFENLVTKRHKEISIEKYLSQFGVEETDPLYIFERGVLSWHGVIFAHEVDFNELLKRFPNYSRRPNFTRVGGKGSLFKFGEDFEAMSWHDCVLINRCDAAIRIKHFLQLLIVNSNISIKNYNEFLKGITKDNGVVIPGIWICDSIQHKAVLTAGQLSNLYLSPKLRETTIGEFIRLHPDVVQRAFDSPRYVYEPLLPWKNKSHKIEAEAINPDLMVQRRSDGYFDIIDLKTAALDRKLITKDQQSRRRFIDYVEEGIAQLAHYAEYFQYGENCKYAENQYDIKVSDPKLILVVGNYENANPEQMREASRKLKGFQIIDYDSLINLYLYSKRNISPHIGRNEKCPCGSGKKYKHCHGILE